MSMPKPFVIALLAIAAFAVVSLALGPSYLDAALPGGLPLGNALTALGLCAAAGAAFGLSTPGTVLRLAALMSLFGAVAWLPVSILIAGNLELNFSGDRGLAWMVFSLVVLIDVLSTLAWAVIASLLAHRKPADAG